MKFAALFLLGLAPAARARAGADTPATPEPPSAPAAAAPAVIPPPVETAPPPPPPFAARGGPDAGALDDALDETLRRREFRWRLPPVREEKSAPSGPLDRFFDAITRGVRRALRAIGRGLKKIGDWWDRLFARRGAPDLPDLPRTNFSVPPRALLYALLAAVALILAGVAVRLLRGRKTHAIAGEAAPAAPPDLTKEEVNAGQLPADGWRALAGDLAARGDFRLALRALYLASLADLGGRGHLTISRAKSNLEYRRELDRRAAPLAGLRAAFRENLGSFEEVWYGERAADAARLARFSDNLEKMREDT